MTDIQKSNKAYNRSELITSHYLLSLKMRSTSGNC